MNITELLILGFKKWKTLLIYVVIFAVLGVVAAFTSKEEYLTSTTLIPQHQNNLSALSGLASSFGGMVDLSGLGLGDAQNDVISPELYDRIISSPEFYEEFLSQEYYFSDIDSVVPVFDYFSEHYFSLPGEVVQYTLKLPWTIKDLLVKKKTSLGSGEIDSTYYYFNDDQVNVIKTLQDRMSLVYDRRNSIVSISSLMPDPKVSVESTAFIRDYVTGFVQKSKLIKLKETLKYLEDATKIAKEKLDNSQMAYTFFEDNNRNLSTNLAQIERDRLKNEYELSFSIYSNLIKQVESVNLKMIEDKPIYLTLSPIVYPVEKEKPRRIIMLAVFMIVGLIVGFMHLLFPAVKKEVKAKLKMNS